MTNIFQHFYRVNKHSAEFVHAPTNTKSAKRPEPIPEEPEPGVDPSQEKWPSTGTQRPGSPQRPSSPQRPPSVPRSPAPKRPSTSPQRPFSPSSVQVPAVPFAGHRPDSEPQLRGPRPLSPTSSSGSMSPTLLDIPAFQLSEKVERLTQDEVWRPSSTRKKTLREKGPCQLIYSGNEINCELRFRGFNGIRQEL